MVKVEVSFQMSRMKRNLWWPWRISFCIPMTISSLNFLGTGCFAQNISCWTFEQNMVKRALCIVNRYAATIHKTQNIIHRNLAWNILKRALCSMNQHVDNKNLLQKIIHRKYTRKLMKRALCIANWHVATNLQTQNIIYKIHTRNIIQRIWTQQIMNRHETTVYKTQGFFHDLLGFFTMSHSPVYSSAV